MSGAARLTPTEIAAAWRPPTDEDAAQDLARFSSAVRSRFGARIKGVYLFGSRARGDHSPESDADVAIVFDELVDGDGLRTELVHIAYDVLLAGNSVIQPFPVSEAEWDSPELQHNPFLGHAMRRDAVSLP